MSDQTPPRLVCRAARTWTAWIQPDRSAEPAFPWAAHVENCPGCQEYFAACGEMDAALRADAQSMRAAIPGLETRVIHAVARSHALPARKSGRQTWGLGLAGLAAASLAVAWYVSDAPVATPPKSDATEIAMDSQAMMETVTAMGAASREWWSTVAPSAADLANGAPLQDELKSVYSDARTAAAFLAKNFLPDTGLGSLEPQTDQPQQG